MNLYRAHYETQSGRIRYASYAAKDDTAARKIAEHWRFSDKIKQVENLRPLMIQLTLEG